MTLKQAHIIHYNVQQQQRKSNLI